jgi:citrate synthase
MMGNLFYRGVAPAEIREMSFEELAYWNRWHELMAKAEKKAAEGKE